MVWKDDKSNIVFVNWFNLQAENFYAVELKKQVQG